MRREKISATNEFLKQLRDELEVESKDSRELVRKPEKNSLCELAFDASVPCITVVWKNYVTSTQLKFIHEYIIQMFQKYAVNKLLGDDSALPVVHSDDQVWIAREWMPRAAAAGFKVAASKVSKEYFGKLSTEGIRSMAPDDILIRFFDDLDAARAWLRAA